MWICNNCSNENEDKSKYCGNCGQKRSVREYLREADKEPPVESKLFVERVIRVPEEREIFWKQLSNMLFDLFSQASIRDGWTIFIRAIIPSGILGWLIYVGLESIGADYTRNVTILVLFGGPLATLTFGLNWGLISLARKRFGFEFYGFYGLQFLLYETIFIFVLVAGLSFLLEIFGFRLTNLTIEMQVIMGGMFLLMLLLSFGVFARTIIRNLWEITLQRFILDYEELRDRERNHILWSNIIPVITLGVVLTGVFWKLNRDRTPTEIYEENKSAVVSIVAGSGKEKKDMKTGSAFFITTDGAIATSYHIIEDTAFAFIETLEGKTKEITHILATDEDRDLAILYADEKNTKVPALASQATLKVGDRVVTIGNPLGLEYTTSEGIVSARRLLSENHEVIQMTASVSKGSSGSPVFNSKSKVIGIVRGTLEGGQALNFFVPVEYLVALYKHKKFKPYKEFAVENSYIHTEKARKYYNASNYESALNETAKALKLDNKNSYGWYLAGLTCFRLNDYKHAKEYLRLCVEDASNDESMKDSVTHARKILNYLETYYPND